MRRFTVAADCLLQDFLLQSRSPLLNKTKIKQLLKFGAILVNGEKTHFYREELTAGDIVEILDKNQSIAQKSREDLRLKIIFEDSDILVVEKPSGLLTMGTEEEKRQTLYFKLTEYVRLQDKKNRIFIVHRLDRDASGLIVFAKTEQAKKALQENWQTATKRYYAVAEGCPDRKSGVIDAPLCEDAFRRVFVASKSRPNARDAVTLYRVISENKSYSLVEVELKTGRKNQIRVHLASLGCPIAGDTKYGAKTNPFKRLALHAYFLSFTHPRTRETKTFQTPLPSIFKI